MKKFFTLFVVAFAVLGVYADDVVIANGGVSSEKAPVETYNGDCYSHHQMIYPAALLQDMKGTFINSLTFHMNEQASKALTTVYDVSLAIVAEDHYEANWSSEYSYLAPELTKVYEGTLDASQSTIVVSFSEPFAYADGNLLLDIQTKTPGNYASSSFRGASQAAVTEIHAGNMSAMPSTPTGSSAFLPMVTFSVSGDVATPCLTPKDIIPVDLGVDYMELSWTAGGSETQWQVLLLEDNVEPDWSKAIVTNETKVKVEGLKPATRYIIYLRSACDGDRVSDFITDGNMTQCAPVATLPWKEDFENQNNGETPLCWSVPYGGGIVYASVLGAHVSSKCLLFRMDEPGIQMVELPEFDMGLDTLAISFWYNTAEANVTLEFGYMERTVSDIFFHAIGEPYPTTKDYTVVENVLLKDVPADIRYLAFRVNATEACYVYVDDIVLDKAPAELPEALSRHEVETVNHKYLKEGHLFIEHNGVLYNAQGGLVK